METLKNFTLRDLFKLLLLPDADFEQWLQEHKLLHTRRFCECGHEMRFKWKPNRPKPLWMCCSKKNHDGRTPAKGFYTGTFFEGCVRITPKQVFEFAYYWCRNINDDEITFQLKLGAQTLFDWKRFARDVTAEYMVKNGHIDDKLPDEFGTNSALNFVDPKTGECHTNPAETTWQKFKQTHKARDGGTNNSSLFLTYVSDFLWRKKFGGPDAFYHFWSQVAELYPIYT
ncbi:hypothetical protein niasHT_023155 [Heterodera trifolii]|uniref:Uncharacterized protein n=1 Tax=Heterodera trifolii TaxID=157864 RepID=A0ABD2JE63_9BILA